MTAMDPAAARAYVAAWGLACVVAAVLYGRDPGSHAISRPVYWRFLLRPWKVATFLVAATGLAVVAPYTRDPTWDWVDATFMSVLTFATAPWAVSVLAGFARGRVRPSAAFVALVVALFSASWSYDLYLLIRDGRYPVTWWANLLASSVLYLCAGLFWSLQGRAGGTIGFALSEEAWRAELGAGGFGALLWPALAFMGIAGGMVLWFLWQAWRG